MIRKRHGWNRGQAGDFRERQPFGRGQPWCGRYIGRGGIAGILEHVLHGATLYPGVGTPGAVRVFVTLKVAVIRRVGVNNDTSGSALLGQVDLNPAEVHAVTGQHDLPCDAHVHIVETLEIFGPPVIGINNIGGYIAGRRRAVEGRQDARVILIGIVVDVLAAGPCHDDLALGIGRLQKNFLRQIEPRLEGNDLRVESRSFEFAGYVDGCLVILFAGGYMWVGSKGLEFFLGEVSVGHCEELLVEPGLPAEVTVTEHTIGRG